MSQVLQKSMGSAKKNTLLALFAHTTNAGLTIFNEGAVLYIISYRLYIKMYNVYNLAYIFAFAKLLLAIMKNR